MGLLFTVKARWRRGEGKGWLGLLYTCIERVIRQRERERGEGGGRERRRKELAFEEGS